MGSNEFVIEQLLCEYKLNPIGLDCEQPRFTWILQAKGRGIYQSAYQLQIITVGGNFEQPLWDSDRVRSSSSIQVPYAGPSLVACTRYLYRVRVWDQAGHPSPWSNTHFFEMGLMNRLWQASWITPCSKQIEPSSEPAFLMRKSFLLKRAVRSAVIYATAAGVYELHVNGQRVSSALLAPGWTSYHHRIQYQAYDVTSLLERNEFDTENCIAVVVGDGWYKSGVGNGQKNFRYGEYRAFIAQLHIQYENGDQEIIVTDNSWKAQLSPILYSNIYHGETYDARLEIDGWSNIGFDDSQWVSTQACPIEAAIVAQENDPTTVTEQIKPVTAFTAPNGDYILDMGQNMVGRIRMSLQVPKGTRIVLTHAEALDQDSNFYTDNLRSAKQRVEYIAKGSVTSDTRDTLTTESKDINVTDAKECYAPHFTFMGFRYVKVEVFSPESSVLPTNRYIDADSFIGEVIHTDMVRTGNFSCSDERVNQLFSNIQWGQRGNFLDVPTDCPQRDERLGWTGDAQVFIQTALFNYRGASFFTKWLRDLRAEQMPDGGVPMVVPDVEKSGVSAGWGDAAVICPWAVYTHYEDKRLLAEQYDSMKQWVEYIRHRGDEQFLWKDDFHCGDWLALDHQDETFIGATSVDLVASAYFAHSTRIVRDTALLLGRTDDYEQYKSLHAAIVQAFRREFVSAAGLLVSTTQTAYALALAFDLLEEKVRPRAARELHNLVVDNQFHLTTGFIGTPYLCLALSNHGYHSTAVKLFFQEDFPSWLYSVKQGATTIWEHWDGIREDGSFKDKHMNSFNHYAYGAIGEWIVRKVCGIELDAQHSGCKKFRIEPLFALQELQHANATYHSLYGTVEASWRIDHNTVELTVVIPCNTSAEIILHGAKQENITENHLPLTESSGIEAIHVMDEGVRLEAGSGRYRFTYQLSNRSILRPSFSLQSRLDDVTSYANGQRLVKEYFPQVLGLSFMLKKATLQQIVHFPLAEVSSQLMSSFLEELNQSF